uniref:Uncharacterized protein n=1 Tax=viral metagenome TaxID=1070528 RepID=A0A6C0H948_9ZZZZ
MAKGRKSHSIKKIRGGQQENKYPVSPIDISKYVKIGKMNESPLGKETTFGETSSIIDISKFRGQAVPKPTLEEIDSVTLTKDDIMGGKLRRTRKRRMSKRKRNIRKNRKVKSRRIRGGAMSDYLPNFITGKKSQQENYDIMRESNSGFENQQHNAAEPIREFTQEEYKEYRNNPNNYSSNKPIDEITMKEKSWFSW